MHSQRRELVYSSVKVATDQGHESLRKGDLEEASKHFNDALDKAVNFMDEYLIRACSFNLGSCLVASGQPDQGLEYLVKAAPPKDEADGLQNFADLQYNVGIAKHALGDVEGAVEAYEKATDAYKSLEDSSMQIETYSKLAVCYKSLKNTKQAVASFKAVANLYEMTDEKENRAIALSNVTTLLAELEEMEECGKTLSCLLDLCSEIDNPKLKGKIYHDVGLLYGSEKCYKSAYECFEHSYHALEDVPREDKDKTLEAVVLLNMGAALNHIALYERAIVFHNLAVEKFGELQDSKSQSQALCNLAFAYSQTEKYRDAKESFFKAIECCKDCNDTVAQCLATEGLAAIFFREENYQKAVDYYKEALALVSKTGEKNRLHCDRIVNKLAEAVEFQLKVKHSNEDVLGNGSSKMKEEKKVGKRRVKPGYNKYSSLVAKGLEEANTEPESDSSFYETESASSSDESESSTQNDGGNEQHVSQTESQNVHTNNQSQHQRPSSIHQPNANNINGNITKLEFSEESENKTTPTQDHKEEKIPSRTCTIQ